MVRRGICRQSSDTVAYGQPIGCALQTPDRKQDIQSLYKYTVADQRRRASYDSLAIASCCEIINLLPISEPVCNNDRITKRASECLTLSSCGPRWNIGLVIARVCRSIGAVIDVILIQ